MAGILKTPRIIQSFERVDRRLFVPDEYHSVSRENCSIPIGKNTKISAPYIHVLILEHLEPYLQSGNKVLDIGSGSGYLSCLFADIIDQGLIIGVDVDIDLIKMSIINSSKFNRFSKKIISGELVFIHKNDHNMLFNPEEMFDAINIGTMVTQIPVSLIWGLKVGGCLIVLVNGVLKKIIRISLVQYTVESLENVNIINV